MSSNPANDASPQAMKRVAPDSPTSSEPPRHDPADHEGGDDRDVEDGRQDEPDDGVDEDETDANGNRTTTPGDVAPEGAVDAHEDGYSCPEAKPPVESSKRMCSTSPQ